MDGAQFIREEVSKGLRSWFFDDQTTKEEGGGGRIHIAMNLPAMAIEFLEAFDGLLSDVGEEAKARAAQNNQDPLLLPMVHVYCFSEDQEDHVADIRNRCRQHLGSDISHESISFVRNVSPNKDMFRVSFPLRLEVLCRRSGENGATSAKRLKTEENGASNL